MKHNLFRFGNMIAAIGIWVTWLQATTEDLTERGFKAVTLTVTSKNIPAAILYRNRGFATNHTFDALVWDRTTG